MINNLPVPLLDARAVVTIYNLDGAMAGQQEFSVKAPAAAATRLGVVTWPADLSSVHFIKLELRDAGGKLVSDNFYWRALPQHADDLSALDSLPTVTIEAKISRHDQSGKCVLNLTLRNPAPRIALMTHLQLRRKNSGKRVLPVYYTDNYISLTPGETKTCSIECAISDLKGETPLVVIDGWNIAVKPAASRKAAIALNEDAQVARWPVSNLPTTAQ